MLQHTPPQEVGMSQSDNAGEYEKLAKQIMPKYGTQCVFSNAYSAQQNAVAERRIGILVAKMRALLLEASLPSFL